jgi:hypothetical protein
MAIFGQTLYPMTRLLSLLLFLLLCTSGRAQETPAPRAFSGTATMVVTILEDSWLVTASSAHELIQRNYVMEHVSMRAPNRYVGFSPVPTRDRYDLRPIHEMMDYLATKGWELLHTNHSLEQANPYSGPSYMTERLVFHFRVYPLQGENATVIPVVLANDQDRSRLRGRVEKSAEGTYSLVMEEQIDGQWQEEFRLDNQGPMAGDFPSRINSISIASNRLVFKLKTDAGEQEYYFNKQAEDEAFIFYGLRYTSGLLCGLINYTMTKLGSQQGRVAGQHLSEPCDAGSKLRNFEAFIMMDRSALTDFSPGSYELKLETLDKTVNY